jgi:hypothetical protein
MFSSWLLGLFALGLVASQNTVTRVKRKMLTLCWPESNREREEGMEVPMSPSGAHPSMI